MLLNLSSQSLASRNSLQDAGRLGSEVWHYMIVWRKDSLIEVLNINFRIMVIPYSVSVYAYNVLYKAKKLA